MVKVTTVDIFAIRVREVVMFAVTVTTVALGRLRNIVVAAVVMVTTSAPAESTTSMEAVFVMSRAPDASGVLTREPSSPVTLIKTISE